MRNATARAAALGSSPDDPILESTWDVFPVAIKDAPVPANARVTWANFANQSNSVATFDVSSNVIAPYVQLDSTLAGRCAAVACARLRWGCMLTTLHAAVVLWRGLQLFSFRHCATQMARRPWVAEEEAGHTSSRHACTRSFRRLQDC